MSKHGKHKGLTKAKARLMLKEGKARGHKLTKKQKGLFGLIASGKSPTKLRKGRKRKSKNIGIMRGKEKKRYA